MDSQLEARLRNVSGLVNSTAQLLQNELSAGGPPGVAPLLHVASEALWRVEAELDAILEVPDHVEVPDHE